MKGFVLGTGALIIFFLFVLVWAIQAIIPSESHISWLKRCSSNYIVARSPFRLFSMMDSRSQDATQGTIFTLQYASAGLIEKQNFFSCYFIKYVQLTVDTNKLALKHYQVFNFNTFQTIKHNSNVWILLHKLHELQFSNIHIYNTWCFTYLKNSTRDKHQHYKNSQQFLFITSIFIQLTSIMKCFERNSSIWDSAPNSRGQFH